MEDHVGHSRAFVAAWELVADEPPGRVLDLGTGGGVPGLVLAALWPAAHVTFLDGSVRRIAFVTAALARLGWEGRAGAVALRAEDAGRGPLRGQADLLVARSFGSPAVTAECAAPLVRTGGWIAVAEPPDPRPGRWPAEGLRSLGLEPGPAVPEPAHIQLLRVVRPVPRQFPRRVGLPTKRPLWVAPPVAGA